ncbi:GntR family transcriptional regulator [Candidatus Acetothermia bacterium]|nr:GntR family transcriptional regulator [Candidatus Acetothermia bacterium]
MARKPLYKIVTEYLLQEVVSGRFKEDNKLPSEVELAEQFNVSRSTLREALGVLAKEGLIQKIHGIGSFVAQTSRGTSAGIESLESYTKTIRRSGHKAEDVVLNITRVELDDTIAAALNPGKGKAGILIESIRLADGVPVIYCRDVLSSVLMDEFDLDFVKTQRPQYESLLDFFEQELKVIVNYVTLSVTAEAATELTSQRLNVKLGMPLLCLSGIAYDDSSDHKPVYHSTNYFVTDHYKFTLIRRKPHIQLPTHNVALPIID